MNTKTERQRAALETARGIKNAAENDLGRLSRGQLSDLFMDNMDVTLHAAQALARELFVPKTTGK